jgi:hypothetical protein
MINVLFKVAAIDDVVVAGLDQLLQYSAVLTLHPVGEEVRHESIWIFFSVYLRPFFQIPRHDFLIVQAALPVQNIVYIVKASVEGRAAYSPRLFVYL